MKILLTGGAGYIGSHVSLELLDNNHEVTIIDNLTTGSKNLIPSKANFLKADIDDEKKIESLIKNNSFDILMHFAGSTSVDESIREPDKYHENNFIKSKKLFKNCIQNNLNKIIFSSSASIYGNTNDQKKIKEDDKKNPQNPYSKSKMDVENYLLSLSNENKIKTIILRYFNVAGADKKERSGFISQSKSLIKSICEVAKGKKDKLVINGNDYKTKDGTTVRDFIHVSDIAEMHLIVAEYLIRENKTDVFNCGYGNGYTIKEVVEATNKILKKELKVEYGPRRKSDTEYSVSDNNKFLKKFNWVPKNNNMEIILRSSLNWEDNLN